ncbi:putative transposase, mutator type, MULE transposase domain-containing protein [Rosa chinensis]|uniref:Putative transposase, mutator type, MULE transposase domain-containing protein n=1 Tax=Rosa chinensis TaxID=74649 RepID=A0A2P6SGK9_ROSCH|nr:putative transposase, mutator type, MULE transposase domain-containing protein [Rosa chinensis]
MAGNEIEEWVPRTEEGGDEIPNYVHPELFTIKMYHGGIIRENKYVGGKISYYDNVDKDKMSLIEVDSMVRGVDPAYAGKRIDYWYSIGSEDDALTKLSTDFDAIQMCCCVPQIRLVVIYLDNLDLHGDYQSDTDDVEMFDNEPTAWGYSQVGSSGVLIEELHDSPRRKCSVKIEELPDSPKKNPEVLKGDPKLGRRVKVCVNKKKAVGIVIREVEEEVPTQASKAPVCDSKDKGKQKVDFEQEQEDYKAEIFEGLVDIDVISEDDASEDADYEPCRDDEDYANYGVDDDWLDYVECEENEETVENHEEATASVGTSAAKRKGKKKKQASVGTNVDIDENIEVEDNEPMYGAMDSDEEGIGHEANSDDEGDDMQRFPEFNPKTDMGNPQFSQTMSAKVQARVSIQQAYRTKKAALSILERSHAEQYSRVKDYTTELKRVDPNTTVDIKCDFNNPGHQPVFKRMYVCLGALKMGFKAGCRSLIGLDGCHLKSPYGGQLLSAVGVDANNSTWVVGYAMVEQECKDSWIWFLELLANDLDIKSDGAGWTFISDKQKGLLPAFEVVLPSAEHRFCVRHLWTNFNKKFPGKALKDQLWAIAKSTTLAYFTKEMVLMNQMEPGAYNYLTKPERPAKHWSRSHFNTVLKCDILLNNLSESFNAFILPARVKPVISMFEEIRIKLMKRIHIRRDKMMKVQDPICPKPREILEKNKVKAATDCIPYGSGSPKIEVESIGGARYIVDIERRSCACRRWDLSGIPHPLHEGKT